MAVKAIPDGFHTVTPYLVITGRLAAAITDYYKEALSALTERFRMNELGPDGKRSATRRLQVGDSIIMLADEKSRTWEFKESVFASAGGARYEPDALCSRRATRLISQADFKAGGKVFIRPIQVQFYGDRSGTLTDPFGHCWTISTHMEDLSIEEINKRAERMMKKG